MPAADWGLLALITLVSAGVQSATGFGFGLLAVSGFLIVLNSAAAIQIAIILTLAISLTLLPKIWRHTPKRDLRLLAAGSAIGFPAGLLAYAHLSLSSIKISVALIILLSAAQAAARLSGHGSRLPHKAVHEAGAPHVMGIGAVSGAMTSCLAMPGPPVMAYLTASGADKVAIRATLISLYVFSFGAALALQSLFVGLDTQTWLLSAALTPTALVGTIVGHLVSPKISQRMFQMLIVSALLATAVYMLITTALA